MIPRETMEAVAKRLNEYRRDGKTVMNAGVFSDIPGYEGALRQLAAYGKIDCTEDITGLTVRIRGD